MYLMYNEKIRKFSKRKNTVSWSSDIRSFFPELLYSLEAYLPISETSMIKLFLKIVV